MGEADFIWALALLWTSSSVLPDSICPRPGARVRAMYAAARFEYSRALTHFTTIRFKNFGT